MNLKGKMTKIQAGLSNLGFPVKVNTRQFYSEETHRMITIYSVNVRVDYYSEKYKDWRVKDYEILSTSSIPDVVICLLDIYKAVSS